MQIARTAYGFALAPLPVLALPLLLSLHRLDEFSGGLLLGYGATLLVGGPVHLTLYAIRRQSLIHYIAGTALVVSLIALLAAALDKVIFANVNPTNPFAMRTLLDAVGLALVIAMLICACVTASIFWFIAVRRP